MQRAFASYAMIRTDHLSVGATMRVCAKCENEFKNRTGQKICDDCAIPCSVDSCTRPVRRRGLCFGHLKGTYREFSDGICSVQGCEKAVNDLGLCSMHAFRFRKTGSTGPIERIRKAKREKCSVDGCARLASGAGLCGMHYYRLKAHGSVGQAESVRAAFGTGSIRRDGYRIIRHNGVTTFEHRVVLEGVLGRPMTATETAHHKDGNRSNNDPANLELWDRAQPPGQRVADKIAWAIALLRKYPEFAAGAGVRLVDLESSVSTKILRHENFGLINASLSFGT